MKWPCHPEIGEGRLTLSKQSNTHVRRARASDVDAIAAMASELAASVNDPAPSLSAVSLRTAIFGANRWADCFVATRTNRLVGYAVVNRYFEPHTGKRALKISDLFVAVSARKSGIGRLLFQAVVVHAKALQCDEISWEVWKQNQAAYRFYERLGAAHVDDVTIMRLLSS